MHHILFFGDSLTAGYGLKNAKTESLPALVQQKIDADKLPYHVINGGLSGDTSAGGLFRLDYWLNRPIHVFVLELGINDIIRGISPQTTYKNLQAIIDQVKQKYPTVKLALMGMEIPAFVPGSFAAEFRTIFRKLADANQMAFVPFYLAGVAGKPHLNLPDMLHPSAEGYRIIADNVWPVLHGLL
ncbi:arylesterase [Mucilaginibacter lappiensis]|uniref:Acyl-CoA thioesterase-1 n=1 Tax=Mucilaginibacter lappiensis TaxID=354630 RepID=A0A841JFC0_9SPHI|nr:arylesterase [Mucilaginibacter lappiensis]MBB6128982.1 acyl-CoA thioesterase-1 [Mucilaginibacter lappiensis]